MGGGGQDAFKWSVSQLLLRLEALIWQVSETEPVKKPHLELLRVAKCQMTHTHTSEFCVCNVTFIFHRGGSRYSA